MSERKPVLKRLLIFLGLGSAYYIWLKITDLGIPCPVSFVTGGRIKCPGCGVSTMCVNIIEGNFEAAFNANPCLFIMLPLWGILIGVKLVFAPKALMSETSKLNTVIYGVMTAVLVVFGVLRNIFWN